MARIPIRTDRRPGAEDRTIKHALPSGVRWFCHWVTLAILILVGSIGHASARDVSVWVYHNFPPYIVDMGREEGISFDLVRYLNDRADGAFTFHVEVLPRLRLNYRLNLEVPGIVLWANPAWFGDKEQTRYLWTSPILADSNVVISPRNSAFEYAGPDSLANMSLVGVRGHSYPGVDDLVADGRVVRFDVSAENHLMHFIATGRGDVAIIADSAARYHVKRYGLEDAVHFSETPHSRYSRNILVQPQLEDVHVFLQDTLPNLIASKDWSATVRSYGVQSDPLN